MACRPAGVRLWNPLHPWKDQHWTRHTIVTPKCRSRERGQPSHHYSTPKNIHQPNHPITTYRNEKKGPDDIGTQPPHGRTPWKGRDSQTGPETSKMGRDESLDCWLHCWMCDMPTEQESAAVFLPCSITITGPGIATLYLKHIYPWFGLPKKVIMDRDPWFTSHFGQALSTQIGAQQNISTAFHPRTDGLSEQKNQWVEQYLRIVTSMAPEDWTSWLSIATAVHNNRKNVTTGLSPNQILWGGEPCLMVTEGEDAKNQTVSDWIKMMRTRRAQAIEAINRSTKQDPIPSSFMVGAQVWLEGTHLHLPYQSTKLAPKRYGPFKITKEISPIAYQLHLLVGWNIHDVFHALLLSPYRETKAHGPNYSRPPPDLIEEEEEYKVEKIVNHQCSG